MVRQTWLCIIGNLAFGASTRMWNYLPPSVISVPSMAVFSRPTVTDVTHSTVFNLMSIVPCPWTSACRCQDNLAGLITITLAIHRHTVLTTAERWMGIKRNALATCPWSRSFRCSLEKSQRLALPYGTLWLGKITFISKHLNATSFISPNLQHSVHKPWRTTLTNLYMMLKTTNVGHFLITALFHLLYSGGQLGNCIASTVGLSSQLSFLIILCIKR